MTVPVIPCAVCSASETCLWATAPDKDFKTRRWEVWKCNRCGHGQTWPRPSAAELDEYYPAAYIGDTHRRMQDLLSGKLRTSRSWRKETEKAALVRTLAEGGRILDVGCSDCSFLLALDHEKWEPWGVDYIGEVVQTACAYFPSLRAKQGDIFSKHLAPSSFDVITFWHVLEHLYEPVRVLERVEQLLRPGGRAVISVPRFDSLQARLFREQWYALDVPRHLHHFTCASLDCLLHRTGLDLEGFSFFSRSYNFHQLKHSVLGWSKARLGSRVPYYLFKPALFAFPVIESLSGQYGVITVVARKQGSA